MITLSTEHNPKSIQLAVNITANVLWLFLAVPCIGLQCMIVLVPDHTHLLFEAMTMIITDSIPLFGTYCIR